MMGFLHASENQQLFAERENATTAGFSRRRAVIYNDSDSD